jgi:outer membrane protein assembly factor BamB
MLKVRCFFLPLVMVSVLFLSYTGWAEIPDQQTQLILDRFSETAIGSEQAGVPAKGDLKGGGDLIWSFQGIANVVCVSKFVDVDGDALPDVLMESYNSGAPVADHFFCIKGNSPGYGTVLWSCRPLGGPSNSGGYGDQCVSYIEDVNEDGFPDVLLGAAWGSRTAFALNGTNGNTIWSYDTYANPPSGWVYSICPISDLTGDGVDDVLFCCGSDANAAYCVNGTNGSLIWKFQAADAVMSICQIEDMNDDGYADAVIAGGDDEHRLICLSGHSTGTPGIIWQFTFPAGFQDVSVIQDVNGDGYEDVVAGGWSYYVYCRNGRNGAQIWNYYLGSGEVVMRVEPIADINDDGIQDVLVGSWKNAVICLSGADGSVICSYTVGTLNGGDVWTVDPIDDVTGDGYPEALGGSFDYYVYCVDVKACTLLWNYFTGNRLYTVRGLPDVNGDYAPDAMAGTQMPTGGGGGIGYCISGGEPQNIVPHIMSISPPQNELNVAVNTNITVRFDVDMMSSSINESTFVVNAWSTGLHQGTITYNSQTKVATLDPSENFDEGEIVTVVLTPGIKSSVGTPMESSYVWTFTTKVSDESPGIFAPHLDYPAGDGPWSLFAADLDGDGDIDLMTANSHSDNVSVLLNNGDATFASHSDYPVGQEPWSIFAADLDGDGDLDVITANMYDNNVSVLLNNGDATFASHLDYPVGESPIGVFAADLDGDGDLDLATSNYGSDNVSVLLNNGDGTFPLPSTYPVGDGTMPVSVFAADVDGDGDLDLQTSNYGSYDVAVLLNNGNGTFGAPTLYPVGDLPLAVFAADLNDDGDLDLETANCYSNSVSVLLNQGDGTFGAQSSYPAGTGPWSVFPADVDGDEDLDLSVSSEFSSDVSVLLNDGDATFTPDSVYPVGNAPYSIFAVDLDGDGDLDLATANYNSDNVSVLLNCLSTGDCNEDGGINSADVVYLINYLFVNGPAPEPLGVGDVNCDGVVNSADVVYLINYLFVNGPAPGCC